MDDTRTLGPRQQGDLGELSAMQWFGAQGAAVFVPITHSSDVDLVVVQDGRVQRVQVKTSGGPKYAEYEIDPGLPFAVQMPAATRLPEAAPRLLSL